MSTDRRDRAEKGYGAIVRFCFIFFVVSAFSSCRPGPEVSSPSPPPADESNSESSFERQRHALVDEFTTRRGALVTDERVIASMRETPRHRFVPESQLSHAYEDQPLPIGHEQTISQPSLVAYMTQKLEPQADERILEIGTGSGYQAAVLAPLVAEVYTIEIVKPLAETAQAAFRDLGYKNIHARTGNGYLGWPEAAPFDAIIVTCAPDEIPPALVEQLREGGRMVIPVGPQGEVQELYLLEKTEGSIEKRAILPVRFVPMTGNPD